MGDAGFLGLMYAAEHGGADADALTNLVFAEALSQSTFGGFIITVLVHTDMASPHLHHAGTRGAEGGAGCRASPAGRTITAVGITEPGAGSDVAGIRTTRAHATATDWVLNGSKLFITNGVHADLYFIAAKTSAARHGISMFIVEKGTPGFTRRPRARQDRAGSRPTPPSWSSTTAASRRRTCSARRTSGFYAVMKNFQNERIVLARDGGRPLRRRRCG